MIRRPIVLAVACSLAGHGLVAGAAALVRAPTGPAPPVAASAPLIVTATRTSEEPPLMIATIAVEPAPALAPPPPPTRLPAPTRSPAIPLAPAAPTRSPAIPLAPAAPATTDTAASGSPATPTARPHAGRTVPLPAGLVLRGLPAPFALSAPGRVTTVGGDAGQGDARRGDAGRGGFGGAGAGDPITGRVSEPARDAYPLRRDRSGGLVYSDVRFTARIGRDGSVTFDDRGAGFDARQVALVFDVNDMIMRARGEDPYSYEKRKFLAATWDLRMRMRVVADAARLRTALHRLPEHLEAVWRDPRRSAADRRRMLYLLWEECDDRAPGGAQARATIEGFVRHRLPPGSADAYTAAELAALNADRTPAFAPYR